MNDGKMPSGLDLLNVERARQHGDALASFDAARAPGRAHRRKPESNEAAAAHRHGRLALREPGRRAGLSGPRHRCHGHHRLGAAGRSRCRTGRGQRSSPRSPAARARCSSCSTARRGRRSASESRSKPTVPWRSGFPCLIGVGGMEKAFAATRSLLICLALHAAVLAELGEDLAPALGYSAQAARAPRRCGAAGRWRRRR